MSPEAKSSAQLQEQKLIERVRAGDRSASRQLIDQHKDRLYAFIRRMVRNHHDAEEICQDAFLKAFASLDSFSSEYRFSTWLFTIGYRVCLNSLRKRRHITSDFDFKTIPLPAGSGQDASASMESEEVTRLRDVVWSSVDQLSTPQRATVLLFYRHEQGCGEIAKVLGLPVATVKSHLHRARAKLRELLESNVVGQEIIRFRNHA